MSDDRLLNAIEKDLQKLTQRPIAPTPAEREFAQEFSLQDRLEKLERGEVEPNYTPQGPLADPVHHPPHYAHPSGVECITVVEHMTFNIGNAVKYLWRAGKKDGADLLEDLQKAAWYTMREIERLKQRNPE